MTVINTTEPAVSIGIDAAVVADHQVAIRGPGIRDDFRVSPTLAGMSKLTERLRPHAGALVVVEPTAGTWLPLTLAVTAAGCRIGFVQNRDSARLRSAIAGRNKTDAIDADMLARCENVLHVYDAPVPLVGQVGLRRALTRRHETVVDAHRVECRLWSLLIWVMPDVWRAAGGHTIIQPLLGKWPDIRVLGRARLDSITQIVSAHSRDTAPQQRAGRIRDAANVFPSTAEPGSQSCVLPNTHPALATRQHPASSCFIVELATQVLGSEPEPKEMEMDNIAVRDTTAPVERTKRRPIFRRRSGLGGGALASNTTRTTFPPHDLNADAAEGTDAEKTPVRSRSGRRRVLIRATGLMVVVASLGTLFVSAAPASAAVTMSTAYCEWGTTTVGVAVSANRAISNGHQWVSVRYWLYSPSQGWQIQTGFYPGFWAVKAGSTWTYQTIYTGRSGIWHQAWVQVAYWDGRQWSYDPWYQTRPVDGCYW